MERITYKKLRDMIAELNDARNINLKVCTDTASAPRTWSNQTCLTAKPTNALHSFRE